ncbi:2OG-Fe(II) oxygenase [Marinobacterium sp. CAU 1594]|nr:2OG-Fe(II) oxygenase [Marinobacterium arenosum]
MEYAETFDRIADALHGPGYTILPNALPDNLSLALREHCQSLHQSEFKIAGIGRDQEHQLNRSIRSDTIHWLERGQPAVDSYLDWTEQLRQAVNRRLFLGLFDYESHYAYYPEGAFYKKHYDAFRGQTSRVLTTVLYLNPDWQPCDGGELLIYDGEGRVLERVRPEFGTLVIFLSEEFPHEVLPVNKPRYSIAGWYRVNNSLGDAIDPPR